MWLESLDRQRLSFTVQYGRTKQGDRGRYVPVKQRRLRMKQFRMFFARFLLRKRARPLPLLLL